MHLKVNYLRNPNISDQTQDAQNVCAVTKGRTILNKAYSSAAFRSLCLTMKAKGSTERSIFLLLKGKFSRRIDTAVKNASAENKLEEENLGSSTCSISVKDEETSRNDMRKAYSHVKTIFFFHWLCAKSPRPPWLLIGCSPTHGCFRRNECLFQMAVKYRPIDTRFNRRIFWHTG